MNIILPRCTIKKTCVKAYKVLLLGSQNTPYTQILFLKEPKTISFHRDMFICKVQSIHPHPVTSLTHLSNSCVFSGQHNFISTQVPSARSSAKESCLPPISKHSIARSIAARLSALTDMMVSIYDLTKASQI